MTTPLAAYHNDFSVELAFLAGRHPRGTLDSSRHERWRVTFETAAFPFEHPTNRSVQLYQKALDSFKDELDARSVTWSAMDEQDKDVFLAEYFIDLKEADAKRQGCQM